MLIAPIFKVDYLSKETETQNSKIRDVPQNISTKSNESTSSRYNIFRTAISRGTELIKNTFLSKSTNFCTDSISVNAAQSSNVVNKNSKDFINNDYISDNSDEDSSSESSDESYSSSPDSIRTELKFFKPIVREPRTTSSNATKILRLPSIRSTSSNSTIHTPCPSPFSIPVGTQRQSAFSFVAHNVINDGDDDDDDETSVTSHDKSSNRKKPKSTKRKNSSTEKNCNINNKKSEGSSPKRSKNDRKKDSVDIKDSNIVIKYKTDEDETLTKRGMKTRQQAKAIVPLTRKQKNSVSTKPATLYDNNNKSNKNDFRRVTRSMKH